VWTALLSEIRSLGGHIIYADQKRIVLSTGKTDLPSAVSAMHFLLESVRKRELFFWLELSPTRWWHCLAWHDERNFGGLAIPERLIPGTEAHTDAQAGGEPTDEQPTLLEHWNMAGFLPAELADAFRTFVMGFVCMPYTHAVKEANALAALRDGGKSEMEEGDGEETDADAEGVVNAAGPHMPANLCGSSKQSTVVDCALRYFEQSLKPNLYRVVPEIEAKMASLEQADAEEASSAFPRPPGAHLRMISPALELVKMVTAVLALDGDLAERVQALRRNLLAQLHIRDFSAEAQFREPCRTARLADVACRWCHDVADLDLNRDSQDVDGERSWWCLKCGHQYPRAEIEGRLVLIAQRRSLGYQLQDVQCMRCRGLRTGQLTFRCNTCGCGFGTRSRPAEVREELLALGEVARAHKLDYLGEVVQWLL